MEIKEKEKLKKNLNRFVCETCDFGCYMKCDWDRHITRAKHVKNVNGNNMEIKKLKKTYNCNCGKNFLSNSGLWKHKKLCNIYVYQEPPIDIKDNEPTDKELILMLLKQNSQLIEQNAELTKNGTNNTLINNSNSNNKTFNLNVFLNETCKDAMNIMDFVDSLKLQLSDLENMGKIGFVEGISNIIVKNLKAMDIHLRPVHCGDLHP